MGRLRMVSPGTISGELTSTDQLIELGTGTTAASGDAGLIVERGTTGDNASLLWDESRDEWAFGTTTATGASSGDLSFTLAPISVSRVGAGTEQAQAEGHFVRDVAASPSHSPRAQAIFEDDARPAIQLAGSSGNIGLIEFADDAAAASGMIYYDHGADTLRIDCGGNADRLKIDASGNGTIAGSLLVAEKAAAVADVAAHGQLWVKDVTPCELYFTTDAGDDIQLTSGTAAAGGGGSSDTDASTAIAISIWMN